MTTTEKILAEIKELTQDTLLATNSGTFGASECHRAVGCGDPAFGTWHTYERLDGTTYTTGAAIDGAPGYARKFSPMSAKARRERIASLHEALKSSKTVAQQQEARWADLARGWDGCRFIGVEEGQRLLDAAKAIVV